MVDNDRVFSSLPIGLSSQTEQGKKNLRSYRFKKKTVKPQQRQQQSTVMRYIVFNEVTVLISRTTMNNSLFTVIKAWSSVDSFSKDTISLRKRADKLNELKF